MNKIHYSPKSQRDLDEIYDYIKYKLCSPIAAKNTVSGILDKIENLKSHSDIGNIWYLENDIQESVLGLAHTIRPKDDAIKFDSRLPDYLKSMISNDLK